MRKSDNSITNIENFSKKIKKNPLVQKIYIEFYRGIWYNIM